MRHFAALSKNEYVELDSVHMYEGRTVYIFTLPCLVMRIVLHFQT